MDPSHYTLEQMDNITDEQLQNFTNEQYQKYLARNKELGRPFEMGGKDTLSSAPNGEAFYYGAKAFDYFDGKWHETIILLGPHYEEFPRAVDEETFRKRLMELGATKEQLDHFINVEVDWGVVG